MALLATALIVAASWWALAHTPRVVKAGQQGELSLSMPASAPTTAAAPSPTVAPPVTATALPAGVAPPQDEAVDEAQLVRKGQPGRNLVALTFDDNYQGERSMRTVQILREYEVPATFFVIGHYTRNGPALAKALAEGGFEIGDHTYSHTDCSAVPDRWLEHEIGGGTASFREITGGETAPLFRPPYGHWNNRALEVAGRKGFRYAVLWDVDTRDWEGRSAAQITDTVLTEAGDGSIVLMHPDAAHTSEALPAIIQGLRREGYRLVTVSELLGRY